MEIRKRRRRIWSVKHRASAAIMLLTAALIGLILLFSINLRPAMTALAEARIRSITARAMNDAILASMGNDDTYAKLIEVHENEDHIYMLQANTRKMNLLAADCSEAAQDRIASLGEQGLSVPLGTVTGVSLLSGKGPKISFSFTPVGSVQTEFSSEFVSSGINQSLYRVNLSLTAAVRLVMPGVSQTIKVTAEAAIAECIIVGDVPQVYTYVPDTESMLNVVPTEVP